MSNFCRRFCFFALLSLSISSVAQTPSQSLQNTPASAPTDQGQVRGDQFHYRGYRFDLKSIKDSPDDAALLRAMQLQADIVEGTSLSEDTKRFLRGLVVHVSEGEGEHGGGGHFSREGVFVSLLPRQDDRPILLHEFMHAYQSARLPGGTHNRQLLVFYNRARTDNLWPANSYMLKNIAEFFAMTASTYLYGHAARPPSTREAIEQKQPRYAEWLSANVR